ncbi:hypothetical protein [Mahella sp.]|uniref:hypothetical protein n=1 Tax=Mahella sp. TaxID=2798721 RepID=UPI0025C66935|nr:hypothetical protein [Mahella sp.]MBZ4665028.1 hypothetical protein [Mahella sp.]
MDKLALMVIDTRNIQKYVFATNNLRQNAGASYLVGCTTREWVADMLPKPNNVIDITEGSYNNEKIEDGDIDAEVIYCGGGNAVIIFKNKSIANSFTRKYTSYIIQKAPGLDVTVVYKEFDWCNDSLSDMLTFLQKEGAAKKLNRNFSTPMLGAGVTAECIFSGLPATHFDESDGCFLSSQAHSKYCIEKDEAWESLKGAFETKGYTFAREFNDIASGIEGSSYIGIVHTDGNGMSKRIDAIRQRHTDPSGNRNFIKDMREFSSSIQHAVKKSLQSTVDKLVAAINDNLIKGEIKITGNMLPFRPIVFNGDDVTFVCHGSIALSLAHNYLFSLQNQTLSDGKPFYGRAGIAIVKSHYPFARAYDLAEGLCASAKQFILDKKSANCPDISAMDWHFAVNGTVYNSINAIREKEYSIEGNKKLYMRPISVMDDDDWRTWNVFKNIVDEFKSDEWRDKRSKIIALQRALRKGENSVANFMALNGIKELPMIENYNTMSKNGWQGGRCGYFDAIEAMDFLIDL